MNQFPLAALEAAVDGLNAVPNDACKLGIDMSEYAIACVLQEGTSALVVHLMPDERYDVLVVGELSQEARRSMSLVCQSIAREWRLMRYSPVGAVCASVECTRE